jgi:GAF domain-containing protein
MREPEPDENSIQPLNPGEKAIGRLIEGSPHGVYLVDAELRLMHASEGAKRLFGAARPLIGRTLPEILPTIWRKAFASEVVDRFRATLSDGEPYVAPRAVERRLDTRVVEKHDWRVERITLPNGRHAVVCHFLDLTDQQRRESALRDAEERLAAELSAAFRLHKLSTLSLAGSRLQTLCDYMLEAATAIMHSHCASMQVAEPGDGQTTVLRLLAHRGFHSQSAQHWHYVHMDATTTCGVALRVRQRFCIADIEQWHEIKGSADYAEYHRSAIRAIQSTPLIARSGAVLGMVSTHWRQPYQPSESELRTFDILARQASDFIEARQTEEARRAADRRKDEFIAERVGELRATLREAVAAVRQLPDADPTMMRTLEAIEGQVAKMRSLVER